MRFVKLPEFSSTETMLALPPDLYCVLTRSDSSL